MTMNDIMTGPNKTVAKPFSILPAVVCSTPTLIIKGLLVLRFLLQAFYICFFPRTYLGLYSLSGVSKRPLPTRAPPRTFTRYSLFSYYILHLFCIAAWCFDGHWLEMVLDEFPDHRGNGQEP